LENDEIKAEEIVKIDIKKDELGIDLKQKVAMWIYSETYREKKFKQDRVVLWLAQGTSIVQYVITMKNEGGIKCYKSMDGHLFTPQSITRIMNVKYNESTDDKKPHLTEWLLIETCNLQIKDSPISFSWVKLALGSIIPTNMQITNLPFSSKTLVFSENIVIQHPDGVIVYNLSKDRHLELEYSSKTGYKLIDVFIDNKSRIYVWTINSLLLLSLKKQWFETVYQTDLYSIKNLVFIREEVCVFTSNFEDWHVLKIKK
jgi:hypothetical protein